MAEIVRIGDTSSHGGTMTTATGRFIVNGKQVCVNSNIHSCPILGHGDTAVTSNGSLNSNGESVIFTGCVAGCGAVIETGSPNTNTD
jgi:uncharacterized Zn-binding protein involved in type VI secretion